MSETSEFKRALVSIEWRSDAPMPALRCPITGKIIVPGYDLAMGTPPEDPVEAEWGDVSTVLFYLNPEVGEFEYITPALETMIDRKRSELEQSIGEEAEELSDFEILEEHVESLGDVPLVFRLTTYDVGPIGETVYVGLDLAAT